MKLIRIPLPFPAFPPNPELDSGAKRQGQSWEAERCRIALVEKIFDAGKECHGGIQGISATQIDFLVTGIQTLIRQEH